MPEKPTEPTTPVEFRPVPGFPDVTVSNVGGIVKVVKTPKHRIYHGHPVVSITLAKGQYVQVSVAELVLLAFSGPESERAYPLHNPDPSLENCDAANLQWKERPLNRYQKKGYGGMLCGESNPQHKLTSAQVKEAWELKGTMTQEEIAKKFGVTKQLISLIFKGKVRKNG